ncbi:hypothetical protein ACHQM5_025168 [Ranunculus cassubicifolius]
MDVIMVKAIGRTGRETITWDEKGKTNILRIYISHDTTVKTLQFGYAEGTSIVLSPPAQECSRETGAKFDAVSLDYPSEYLTGITGSYYSCGICLITFHTNQRSHGPFGTAADNVPKMRTLRPTPMVYGYFVLKPK